MELIDFHAHLLPSEKALEELLLSMKKNHILRSIVVAGGLLSRQLLSEQMQNPHPQNVDAPNQKILELSLSTKGKLLPFYFANPQAPCAEYKKWGNQYYGLKLGPAIHGVPLTDRKTLLYLEIAAEFQHPVYLHCLPHKGFDIAALKKLAFDFPSTSFILGHCGIGHCDFFAVDSIQKIPHIYLETSGGFSSILQYAIHELGPKRILFGSEYPLQDPFLEIQKIKRANISIKILNQNIFDLLSLSSKKKKQRNYDA